jgi:glycosyltransferase involved in cell wall biosynthesis
VLGQSFEDWRLVVVDDGSPVPQHSCIADIVESDPRITVLRLDTNRGAGAARNAGIRHLDEDWIAFLDADDEWDRDKLAYQLEYIERAGINIGICCTGYLYRRCRGGTTIQQSNRLPKDGMDHHRLIYGCDLSSGTTMLARRDLFTRFGEFDETLARFEDWDWLLRCLMGGARFQVVPRMLATVHNNQWPSYHDVVRSVAILRRRFAGRLRRDSVFDMLRFLSSLHLECAVAALHENRLGLAAAHGLLSFAAWPFRNRQHYGRVFQQVGQKAVPSELN